MNKKVEIGYYASTYTMNLSGDLVRKQIKEMNDKLDKIILLMDVMMERRDKKDRNGKDCRDKDGCFWMFGYILEQIEDLNEEDSKVIMQQEMNKYKSNQMMTMCEHLGTFFGKIRVKVINI